MQSINDTIPAAHLAAMNDIVASLYLVCGKSKAAIVGPGMIYDSDSRETMVAIDSLHRYLPTSGVEFGTEGSITAEFSTLICNYLSDETLCLMPVPAEHDIFTDLLYTVWTSLSKEDYPMAFTALQCFLLMSRICSERLPMITGNQPPIEVKPYVL